MHPGSEAGSTSTAGRVPWPPRQGGRAAALLGIAALLLGGAALLLASILMELNERLALGLQILGGLLLVPGALAALLVVPALLYGWRNRPVEEVDWVPLPPRTTVAMSFEARRARYHGVWLCADVRHPFGGGPRALVTTIEGQTSNGTAFTERIATCWGFPGDPTGATHMFVNGRRPRYGDLTPSLMELDRIVEARPTGRYRAVSQLWRMAKLAPGTKVRLRLRAEPPPDATETHLHAFVALPR